MKKRREIKKRLFKPPPGKYFILHFSVLIKIFLALLFVLVLIFFWQSGLFEISVIDCKNEGFSCSDKEKELFNFVLGRNIFFIKKEEILNEIRFKDISLKKITLKKKFPNCLIVRLEKREPLVVLSSGKDYFLLDEEGFVFSLDKRENSVLPVVEVDKNQGISLGTQVQGQTAKSLELVKALESFFLPFEKVVVEKDNFVVHFSGFRAVFSSSEDFFIQAGSLQLLLQSSKINEHTGKLKIDLRFDKPVITTDDNE